MEGERKAAAWRRDGQHEDRPARIHGHPDSGALALASSPQIAHGPSTMHFPFSTVSIQICRGTGPYDLALLNPGVARACLWAVLVAAAVTDRRPEGPRLHVQNKDASCKTP